MSKIAVLGMETERRRLLESLMNLGVVQINECPLDDESSQDIQRPSMAADLAQLDHVLSDIASAIEAVKRYSIIKKPLFSMRRAVNGQELMEVFSRRDEILAGVSEINALEAEVVRLRSEENRQRSILLSLEPWLDLELPLDVADTRTTVIYTGTVPAALDYEALEKELCDQVSEVALIKSGSDREHHYMVLVSHKSKENDALTYLKGKGFNRVSFRDMEGSPRENRERILNLIVQLGKEREDNIGKIKARVSALQDMEALFDAFKLEKSRAEAASKLVTTRSVFLLRGWIPAEVSEKVKASLERDYLCSVTLTLPEKDEDTPVLVRNGSVTEAIQPVINMYGVPSSKEIDPSGTTMFFFIFFFGLIISDAGYGLILAAASGLALKLFKMEAGTRRFMKLILFSGLATIFWGAMFGGFFGIEALADYGLWFNPGAKGGTEQLMVYCLLFGVIHLYVGHFMKALNLIRRKEYLDVLFDVIFPVIMYTGFAMFILPNVPGMDPAAAKSISEVGINVLLVGIILTIATAGRKNKNIIGKILGGLPKLYDIIGFLGDVLSYMRLLALSLSGAILAGLVNGMAGGGGIVFKLTAGLIILALGHAINFGMGILGAFVHSCRLQYLEFFSKFLEGGGEPFRPFKANTQYVMIKQEDVSL